MAIINEETVINGVNLPYIKQIGYTGTKESISVSVGYSAGKEFNSMHSESINLTNSDSKELADEITALIYEKLKTKGYISGDDV